MSPAVTAYCAIVLNKFIKIKKTTFGIDAFIFSITSFFQI